MEQKKWTTLFVMLSIVTRVSSQQTSTVQHPTRKVTEPPLIIREPEQEAAFREGDSLKLTCEASGQPRPKYRWQMNEQDFDPSSTNGRIVTQSGVGTLIFTRLMKQDEGQYQCFAQNEVGTAITVKINLRMAYLEPFQSAGVITQRPLTGHSQTLRCIPPRSFPKPSIFWAIIESGESFKPINLTVTDRITIDPEEHPERLPPDILWQSPTHQVALRTETWRITCIFSGNPTPHVDWWRYDKDMPPRYHTESFGQELVIENVQFEDEGRYVCQGINDETQTPIRKSFELSIESKPFWTRRPEPVNAADNHTKAEFFCEADGLPEPKFFWFLDGVPIEKVPSDPRRIEEKNKLTFNNMTKDDAQVIQCNATNKHGYIFADAYLNVLYQCASSMTNCDTGNTITNNGYRKTVSTYLMLWLCAILAVVKIDKI